MKTKGHAKDRQRRARTCVACGEAVHALSPCPSCPNPYHAHCAPRVESCGALGCPAGAAAGAQATSVPETSVVCPYCRSGFTPDESCTGCQGCRTRYHAECATELGRCAVLGCARKLPQPVGRPAAPLGRRAPAAVSCAACSEPVEPSAVSCCPRCMRTYHPRCAVSLAACACGRATPEFYVPWPLYALIAAFVWALGGTAVVATTWPVLHAHARRLVLLGAAYGPLIAAGVLVALSADRIARSQIVVDGKYVVGNVLAVGMVIGGAFLCKQAHDGGGAVPAVLGLLLWAAIPLLRVLHPGVGRGLRRYQAPSRD